MSDRAQVFAGKHPVARATPTPAAGDREAVARMYLVLAGLMEPDGEQLLACRPSVDWLRRALNVRESTVSRRFLNSVNTAIRNWLIARAADAAGLGEMLPTPRAQAFAATLKSIDRELEPEVERLLALAADHNQGRGVPASVSELHNAFTDQFAISGNLPDSGRRGADAELGSARTSR